LAQELLAFLDSPALQIVQHEPDLWERTVLWVQGVANRRITRRRLKAVLVIGLSVLGLLALTGLSQLLFAVLLPQRYEPILTQLSAIMRLTGPAGLDWYLARTVMDAATGLLLVVAALLLVFSRETQAFRFGYIGL